MQTLFRTKLLSLALASALLGACSTAPERQASVTEQAHSAYELEDWALAEQFYQEAVEAEPDDTATWIKLGNMRLRQDNYSGAAEAYEAAMQTEAYRPKSHYNLATSYLLIARDSLEKARNTLPEGDVAQAVIDQKLSMFDSLLYGPVDGVTLPAIGVFE